ncbi:MAG: hypothetical protein NW218_18215 [Saprospiraceae bacterium]|nr:hypothetical protein [Saprospiraceae bacterium]
MIITQNLPVSAQLTGFSPASRVWVYVSARALTEAEATIAQSQLQAFAQQWTAHNQALKAHAEVFNHQIAILIVDETQAGASGCSIDKSVHFLENLGAQFQTDFFERMLFFYQDSDGNIQSATRDAFAHLVQNGVIQAETLVLNNLVKNLEELNTKWWVPFQDSWHKKFLKA